MTLVTGTGFIGRAISDSLGDDVVVLNQKADGPRVIECDLTDPKSLEAVLSKLQQKSVTQVVHTAAITPWSGGGDYSDDLRMAENMVHLCDTLGVKVLVFISGWNVYDMSGQPPYDETTPLKPLDDYGKSKLAVEQYFKQNLKTTKLVCLRTASVYGPGQRSAGLIPNLVGNALRQEPLVLNATDVKRDYVYIQDFVRAVNNIIKNVNDSLEVNIGSGSHSVMEVAQTIQSATHELTGRMSEIITKPADQPTIPVDNQLDTTKAKSLGILGASTAFDDGIKQYVQWRQDENIL